MPIRVFGSNGSRLVEITQLTHAGPCPGLRVTVPMASCRQLTVDGTATRRHAACILHIAGTI